jgi:hypothetical protein
MKTVLMTLTAALFAASTATPALPAAATVDDALYARLPGTDRVVHSARIDLPGPIPFRLKTPDPASGLVSAHLLVAPAARGKSKGAPTTIRYTVLAVRDAATEGPIALTLIHPETEETVAVRWDPETAREAPETVIPAFRRARVEAWWPYAAASSSPVLRVWLDSRGDGWPAARSPRRGRGRVTSAFGMLGGQAAVEETLQMQVLAPDRRTATPSAGSIPVSDLGGVEVASHPFDRMLGEADGGRLDLARVVPPDRFFVHVARPDALMPFLDEGARFISSLGGRLTGNAIQYDLTDRYLARLGLSRPWIEKLLKSGAISELAVMAPDLFFIDGTELTVVSRMAQPEIMTRLLGVIGVTGPLTTETVVRRLPDGRTVHWAVRGDLIFLSTDADELAASAALHERGGEGSLGDSTELRYMLTQLPVTDSTRIFAYLSDPFIRRLTGPTVKLGQLRRTVAAAEMAQVTAAGLLALADGVDRPDLDRLVALGYLPERYKDGGYQIGEDGAAVSETYGTLSEMTPLSRTPVEMATPAEADAYRGYLEAYQRYWRQYFDPIAVRLSDTPDGGLELETFILPLIDNSIYRSLREGMDAAETGPSLKVPELSPEPVLLLSANLQDKVWQGMAMGVLNDLLGRHTPLGPSILTDLVSVVHLAIHDADPVIALGSGDILGAFGGSALGRGSEMLMAPVLLSILTRPSTLILETRDPDRTLALLRDATGPPWTRPHGGAFIGRPDFYRIDGEDAFILTLDVMGLMKLRYGIEVDGRYILIRNIPWAADDRVTGTVEAGANGARLTVRPGACRRQLAALRTAAGEAARQAAMDNIGHLYPIAVSGMAENGDLTAAHARLFGFRPVHPGPGEYRWESGELVSTAYGSVTRQRQPSAPDPDAALLSEIEALTLEMQFEADGLRTRLRWRR